MFIRRKEKTDRVTGKKYFIYQLVESFRTEKGPRQRILLNLGNELALSEEHLKLLANRIEEMVAGIQSLVEYPREVESLAEDIAKRIVEKGAVSEPLKEAEHDYHSVDLNSVEHSRARTVGMEYIAYETIKKLKLDKKLLELGLSQRQVEIAIALVVGKLACPRSELATYHWMQNESAMEELLKTHFDRLSLDSVYKVGDILLRHKEALEDHLASTERDLFHLDNTIVLYDLTNTFFEGTGEAIPHAARGHSKERRTDCPLVTLGLVLNKQGFPIRSKVLPGNVSEPSTLQEAIDHLSASKNQKPIIVLDAGIATEDNLSYLRDLGYCYLVASRTRSCVVPEELELVKEEGHHKVYALQVHEADNEVLLYCHSTQRQEKAMRSLLQSRFETDLQAVADALGKKRGTKSYPKVLERLGRLKQKHRRIASYYDIHVEKQDSQVIAVTWKTKDQKLDHRFQGAYLLRSYGLNWSSKDLWETYVMLTEVEEAFRCLKSELGLRPIYHQKGPRVDAHLFMTLLAYHVMQTVLHELRLAGISMRWETLRRQMRTQVRVTTTMRLQTGQMAHIRTSTKPESSHREIYKALNLSHLPGRRVTTVIQRFVPFMESVVPKIFKNVF